MARTPERHVIVATGSIRCCDGWLFALISLRVNESNKEPTATSKRNRLKAAGRSVRILIQVVSSGLVIGKYCNSKKDTFSRVISKYLMVPSSTDSLNNLSFYNSDQRCGNCFSAVPAFPTEPCGQMFLPDTNIYFRLRCLPFDLKDLFPFFFPFFWLKASGSASRNL